MRGGPRPEHRDNPKEQAREATPGGEKSPGRPALPSVFFGPVERQVAHDGLANIHPARRGLLQARLAKRISEGGARAPTTLKAVTQDG